MSVIARQSTARTVIVGPILDADGVAVTGAVIGDVKIAKNGGAPAAFDGSATLTHRHTGFYSLAATANDLDTVGQAEVTLDKTTDTMPVKIITVVEEAVYDRLFAASGAGYSTHAAADVWAVATRVLTAGTNIVLAKGTGVTGFNDLDAAGIRTAVGLASANLDTQLADLPTVAEFNARTLASASYATAANQTSIEGKIDTIDGLIDTHNAIWTSTRAGYLDNANVGGLLASQADVQAITQAQRVRISLPNLIERPDSGSTAYRIWIYVYNELHQAEDLDSNPTVTAENNAGTDRSTNLGTVTKPTGTGIYYVDYTVASGHAIEGLIIKVAATEGAVTTNYAAAAMVVDTTAVDFTSADRAKLDALHDTRLTADRAGYLDNLSAGAVAQSSELAKVPKSDGTVSWNATALAAILAQAASALSTYDAPTRAELTSDINSVLTRLGTPAGASVSADIAAIDALIDAIKLVTDQIPDGGALTALLASIAAILDDTGTNGVVVAAASKSGYALTSGERDSIAAALLDLASAIDGKTLRQALRYIAAMVAGKVSGAGSGTETFKGLDGVTDRVEITADASGNRTAASYDP